MSLPIDHRASDALAALSFPTEATPGGLSRRRFLAGLGAAGAVAAIGGPAALRLRSANAAAGNNLVVLYLSGGNDGFATVMPTGASELDQLRPSLLVNKATLLGIGGGYGLHPALPTLHSRFNAGQVAVVGGVGATSSLSHFESGAEWMVGAPNPGTGPVARTGWVGRWLDSLGPADDQPLRATSVTSQVPLMLVGETTAGTGIGIDATTLMGSVRRNPVETGLFEMIEAWGADADITTGYGHAALMARNASSLALEVGGLYHPALPMGDPAVAQALLTARLLNDPELACRVVFASIGGFDHHADLVPSQVLSLGSLDRALATLFTNLTPAVADRTAVLVFSEFGRRPSVNGSKGADHGTSSYAFVVGPAVHGGFYGVHPDPSVRDANGNPSTPVRHLDLIGSVLGPWLGADANALVGTTTTDLGIFTAGPPATTTTAAPTTTGAPTTTVVPTTAVAPTTTAPPVTTTTTAPTTTTTRRRGR